MELYRLSSARNGSQSDHHPAEWDPAGGETGLEGKLWSVHSWFLGPLWFAFCVLAMRRLIRVSVLLENVAESMWQLELGSSESYPERPGVSDCAYYMRTGFCGYGRSCRYNHPRDRAAVMFLVVLHSSSLGQSVEHPVAWVILLGR